jgi:hypothetical protein
MDCATFCIHASILSRRSSRYFVYLMGLSTWRARISGNRDTLWAARDSGRIRRYGGESRLETTKKNTHPRCFARGTNKVVCRAMQAAIVRAL